MVKKILLITTLCIGLSLTGCSLLPSSAVPKTEESPEQETDAEEETSQALLEEEPEEEKVNEEDMPDEISLEEALFQSTASTVQMEVTTGLTTEYLANLCNFPIIIEKNGEEKTVSDEAGLEDMGLEAIYTEALLKAVGDFDVEKLQIREGTAILGDMETAYIVLGRDENEVIGINEIHCGDQ